MRYVNLYDQEPEWEKGTISWKDYFEDVNRPINLKFLMKFTCPADCECATCKLFAELRKNPEALT